MSLCIGWWNTSLSPPLVTHQGRSGDEHKKFVLKVINGMLSKYELDFLVLGEICPSDVSEICEGLEDADFVAYDSYHKDGRLIFDTCFIYRSSTVKLESDVDNIIWPSLSGRRKIGQRIDVKVHDRSVSVIFSHWASRLSLPASDPDRIGLGERLRTYIESMNGVLSGNDNLILLGDYNDEPFDVSLSKKLGATRDRNLVLKKSNLLYNPFWRKLGHSEPMPYDGECEMAGTHFYKGGVISKWVTFDQIIFSSSFLIGDWKLNESECKVVDLASFDPANNIIHGSIDHYPVLANIKEF